MQQNFTEKQQENQPDSEDDKAWLTLLENAHVAGLLDAKVAQGLSVRGAMGLLAGDTLAREIQQELARGPAAEMALDAITLAFAPSDVIELRALDPAGAGGLSVCGTLGDPTQRAALAGFIREHTGRRNLYVGVNPRRAEMAGTKQAASAVDVVARRSVVLDLDHKDAPDVDPKWTQTVQVLMADADPLLVVDSGNGVHVWLSVEALSGEDVAASTGPLAAAMARVGADNMADPPRIIRLPFTVNLPTATKRARGAVACLAVPISGWQPKPLALRAAPPSVARLCSELESTSRRMGLPGRGCGQRRAVAASGKSNRYGPSGERKTGRAAPSADLLRLALEQLPNDGHFDHRNEWMALCHAVKGACMGADIASEGRDAWMEWCARWKLGGDPDHDAVAWDSITEPGTGWGTLMRTLERVNPAGASCVKTAEAKAAFADHAAQNRAALMAVPFAPVAPRPANQIPPRRWLYGRAIIKGFLSFLVAPGGAGKSALAMVEAVAMASGKELLAGEKPICPQRVWMHNAEDDLLEMQRRLAATLQRFGLSNADLNGNLFMTSGRDIKLQLARTGRDGPEIVPGIVDALVERLVAAKVDVLILDPLGALHTLPENSNEAANLLSSALREVAHRADVAVIVLHHTGKAAAMDMDAAGAGASRGASAFVDAARVVRQVVRMTDKEAARHGISEDNRRDYLRVENGKANLARAEGARWLRMVSVNLGNGSGYWPDGDRVGVIERWTLPTAQPGTISDLARVQAALDASPHPARADLRSRDWIGWLVANALALDAGGPDVAAKDRTADQAAAFVRVRAMVSQWLQDGGLIAATVRDPASRKDVKAVKTGKPAVLTNTDAASETDGTEGGEQPGRATLEGECASCAS